MKKILFSVLIAYGLTIAIELPVKQYVTGNPLAYVTVTDLIMAPVVVPAALGMKVLANYSNKCMIGCK